MSRWTAPATSPRRHRQLRRSPRGRVVAGVAAGLAEHLGVDVLVVRLVLALLVATGGAGVLLYVALWVTVPGPEEGAGGGADQRPVVADPAQLVAYGALALGITLLCTLLGLGFGGPSAWPIVAAAVGATLIWRQADEAQRRQWLEGTGLRRRPVGGAAGDGGDAGAREDAGNARDAGSAGPTLVADAEPLDAAASSAPAGRDPPSGSPAPAGTGAASGWPLTVGRGGLARVALGFALVAAGVAGFLAANNALRQAQHGLLAIVAVVAGLVLVTGPWWLRMAGALAAERRERIRTQERAELAARIHDSVLHTLALIQRSADDPREVARLARSQERDLRTWLYRLPGTATPDDRLGAAVEQAAGEVEDSYAIPIEVVVVGDAALDDRLRGLVLAAREAMVNAAKSSGAASVSVYVEVEDEAVRAYVRDRGNGFDLAAVGPDRYGIKESIVGRMARHGGTAEIRTAPGAGTEVRLCLERRGP
ncbi:MAG: PspC domain-containing protein [Frankiaceae bacterium]